MKQELKKLFSERKETLGGVMSTADSFVLEIVNHETGDIEGSEEGTAYFLSTQLQTILEALTTNEGVTITRT